MSDWSKPNLVLETIRAGDDAAQAQGQNRVRINDAANGAPPLDPQEAEEIGLKINVNFGDLIVPLANARRSYVDAVLGQERFFKITIPKAPPEQKDTWALTITNLLNDALKEDEDLSREYVILKRNQIGAVVLHGQGPVLWYDPDAILPEFVALEDLRIPKDTLVGLKNTNWIAVRHAYTPGELVKKVWGKNVLPGWNKKAIAALLKSSMKTNYASTDYNWGGDPEKVAESMKQVGSYFSSDAMPTISLWHFYFQDQDLGDKWYLAVVPDKSAPTDGEEEAFLYQSSRPVADKLSHLFQCQYGDLNTKPPFLHASTRSLGFLLIDPTWWTNFTRCRLMQHAHESMNAWFKVADPVGKPRAQLIELYDKCIIPEGVSVVPQNERHQIDAGLVESVLAQVKQVSNEASASYTHELDTGTQKEQTATETMANLQRVNAMMSGLLGAFFTEEKFFLREVCRRFCRDNTTNKHAQEFQQACHRAGIPGEFLDVKLWRIEVEKPMGSGNPTMAIMQADKMMSDQIFTRLGPDAQQDTLRDAIAAVTGDPRKAAARVPAGQGKVSSGAVLAFSLFGSLMAGAMGIRWPEGVSVVDGVGNLIGLLAGKCQTVQKAGGMTDAATLAGLMNTGQFIGGLIGQMAQDKTKKPLVKKFSYDLGGLSNEIRGFAKRLQESQQQQQGNRDGGEDAKLAAQIKGKLMVDSMKSKQKELDAVQKRRHKETAFAGDQQRKDVSTLGELKRGQLRTLGEVQAQHIKAANAPAPKNNGMKSTTE